jgi:hypothetical protein
MQGNIIAVSIPVSRKGELNFFQVNIPDDVKGITGIVAEINGFSIAPDLSKRILAGTLKLQAEQSAGICYNCQLFTGRNSIEDVIKGFTYAGGNVTDLYPSVYSGSTFRGIQPVQISGSYVVFGCFEDNIGNQMDQDVAYNVVLHLYAVWN